MNLFRSLVSFCSFAVYMVCSCWFVSRVVLTLRTESYHGDCVVVIGGTGIAITTDFGVADVDRVGVVAALGFPLHWRHNGRDGVSNHQSHDCLLNRIFRRRSKKTSSSASLAFVRGNHRGPVNSPHKGPVTRKMFPFDDVIMHWSYLCVKVDLLNIVLRKMAML